MKVKYVKSHNNYDFVVGQVYEASKYKNGWLMIEGQLYREEQFEYIAKEIIMDEIKRNQKVWVSTRRGIHETVVKSIGSKFITLEYNSRKKFYRNTLKEVNACGVADFIILDLKEYQDDIFYNSLIRKFERFDWDILDREDLDKIENILRDY